MALKATVGLSKLIFNILVEIVYFWRVWFYRNLCNVCMCGVKAEVWSESYWRDME